MLEWKDFLNMWANFAIAIVIALVVCFGVVGIIEWVFSISL